MSRANFGRIAPSIRQDLISDRDTGLGLSISHDIIVKQHGGSIEVDTRPGEFTEIKITLPRSGVFPTEPTTHA
jgi:signal transduction histidine kinase